MVACAKAFVACQSGASSAEVWMATGTAVVASAPPITPTLLARIARCRWRQSGSSVPESIALPFRIMVGQTAQFVTSGCGLGRPPAHVLAAGQSHYRLLTEGSQFYNTFLTAVCVNDHVHFSGSNGAGSRLDSSVRLTSLRPSSCEAAGNDLGVSCQRSAGPGLAA